MGSRSCTGRRLVAIRTSPMGRGGLAGDADRAGTPARSAALAQRRSLEDIATPLSAAGSLSAKASGRPGGRPIGGRRFGVIAC